MPADVEPLSPNAVRLLEQHDAADFASASLRRAILALYSGPVRFHEADTRAIAGALRRERIPHTPEQLAAALHHLRLGSKLWARKTADGELYQLAIREVPR